MKKLILITIASVLLGIFCSAAPVITAKTGSPYSYWNLNNNWNLLRQPLAGDTIIIPAGANLVILNHENYGNGNLYIKVYGTLNFLGGILTMGSGSTINVYPGGKITGTGSNAEQIRMGNVKKFQGNEEIVGPQIANSSTGNGFNPYAIVLPVKFIAFTATAQDKNALIQWSTTEEVNADRFELQRSENGSSWNTIATVAPTGNSGSTVNHYSYTDKNIASEVMYYRIKEVDMDGSFMYTAVQLARFEKYNKADIKISSGQGRIVLQFPVQVKGVSAVQVYSLSGQLVNKQSVSNAIGQVVLNSNLKGHYIVAVQTAEGKQSTAQIIL